MSVLTDVAAVNHVRMLGCVCICVYMCAHEPLNGFRKFVEPRFINPFARVCFFSLLFNPLLQKWS